jgi:hypothetical protein
VPRAPIATPIDAVSGHADDQRAALQGADDAELERRHRAGDDGAGGEPGAEPVVVERLELGAGRDVVGLDPGPARDRPRGVGVIAGDHDDADPGAPARRDRRRDVGAQRIGEPDQAEHLERHVVGIGRRLDR